MARVEHLTLHKPRHHSPLRAAMDAFLLSREAARCTPKTIEHYTYTIGAFLDFLQSAGVISPQQITPNHIRRHLVTLQRKGLKDTTQHPHARGIKAWLNWLVAEGELDGPPMRRVAFRVHAVNREQTDRQMSIACIIVSVHPLQSVDSLWPVRRSAQQVLRIVGLVGERVRTGL